ncbi:AAA family ATPase (plasmid) [Priestia aryabhattai]|uniref:AAA family ATPase n=1 Tax=Priestia aryabhattai TaxID=412384 RepID=UPI003568868A
MKKIEDLRPHQKLKNQELVTMFKCGNSGGMRRSLKTNSLLLISDRTNPTYKNLSRDEEGIWHFTGMGRKGDQSISYLQNKTLFNSNSTGVSLYLFECIGRDNYVFIDCVLLASKPYLDEQLGEDKKLRKAIVFKLIQVGHSMDFNTFIEEFKDTVLIGMGIVDQYTKKFTSSAPGKIIHLMKERNIDTLLGLGGWFLSKTGYFYNPSYYRKHPTSNFNFPSKDYRIPLELAFENQDYFLNPFNIQPLVIESSHEDTPGLEREKLMDLPSDEESIIRVCKLTYQLKGYDNVEVIFDDATTYNVKSPFSTLIIGPNGTGKSTSLSIVQKIFLELFYLKQADLKSFTKDILHYNLKYTDGHHYYQLIKETDNKNLDTKMTFIRDNEEVSLNKVPSPQKLISSAFSIHDRFTYKKLDDESTASYDYLGIKSSSNAAMLGAVSKNLVYNIMQSSLKDDFLSNLKLICDFLSLNHELQISFPIDIKARGNKRSRKDLVDIINNFEFRGNKTSILVDPEDVADFLLEVNFKESLKGIERKKNLINIHFDLENPEQYESSYDNFQIIWYLYEIKYLKRPNVLLKKDEFFPIEEASSGEAHFITTMINLLSKVEKKSIILIDEPETSLHPNWQNQYIYILKKIFTQYWDSHFIIATHSHFFVSDLEPSSSSIVSLKKESSKTISTLHEDDTFGWSADDVLYYVFDVPTSRNYSLAKELDDILLAISTNKVSQEIQTKIKKVKTIQESLKPSDPLKELIPLLLKKVEKKNA